MSLENTYLIVIGGTIVLSMIIMSFLISNNIVLEQKQKRRFVLCFLLIAIESIVDVLTTLIETDPNAGPMSVVFDYFLNCLGFGLAPLIPLTLCNITYKNKLSNLLFPMWLIYFLIIIFLVGFNQMFIFTPQAGYSRQLPGFIFYLVFSYLSIMLLFANFVLLSRKMISKTPYLLYVLFFFLAVGTLVQVFNPKVHSTYLIVCIITIIFYDYISALWGQIDGLTGLFSQHTFIQRCKFVPYGSTILFFDVDGFKNVNDAYGHLEGDKILRIIAKTLQNSFGKYGRCYRIGGDEFAVLIKPGIDVNDLIINFDAEIKKVENGKVPNVSVGYTVFEKGMTIEDAREIADQKMYQEKNRRKTHQV